MPSDLHDSNRQRVNRSLAEELSAAEQRDLFDHLQGCAACREYAETSRRVVNALGSVAFKVEPGLERRVMASLSLRSAQLEAEGPTHNHLGRTCAGALLLTAAGSFALFQFGAPMAAAVHMQPAQMQVGVVVFWALPSLILSLLLPVLPRLSSAWMDRKGWTL